MGGTFSVDSTEGVGSTFAFDVVMDIAAADEAPAAPAGQPANLAGLRALVVDDNDTNRRILSLQLESWGVQCVDVANGAWALATLGAGTTFDLAILDMHMPGMDGQELASRIRGLPRSRSMPLMLLTSLGAPPDSPDLFDAFHTKPVRSTVLRTMVATLAGIDQVTVPEATSPVDAHSVLAGATRPRPLYILLAEDNPVNQRVGRLMLENLGHIVDIAGNGVEALEAALAAEYDLVLMDVHMPVMDGMAATRAIRAQLSASAQPRIIALTASSLVEDRTSCTAAGMDAYLLKPVRLEKLAAALEDVPQRQPDLVVVADRTEVVAGDRS